MSAESGSIRHTDTARRVAMGKGKTMKRRVPLRNGRKIASGTG